MPRKPTLKNGVKAQPMSTAEKRAAIKAAEMAGKPLGEWAADVLRQASK